MVTSPLVNIYPLSDYSFGSKELKIEKDTSVADRLARMKLKILHADHILLFRFLDASHMKEGMRTSVKGILLAQEHNHPHLCCYKLEMHFVNFHRGRLKPGENDVEGLKRKLSSKLAANLSGHQQNWQIGECVAVWWRPNFETVMYPYCSPHVTNPKECKKLFIVHLPDRVYFAVPKNLKLLAVPLFELYDNVQLSRFHFKMVENSLSR